SWYTSPKAGPHDYLPILGGVVYVHKPSISGVPVRFDDLQITKVADRHKWRDNAGEGGLMFVLVLPPGYGIIAPKPMPIEGKSFDDRLALFWLLFPPFEGDSSSVIAEWSLGTFTGELDREVE